ncbi:MAG: UbiA family prenyltransferase [Planctomycetota bacterium]
MQLIRLPNVFTVLADVSAAFLLIAGAVSPVNRFALVLTAGVCLYWSGMILNDVFDVEKDRQERSSRPIASGAICIKRARVFGWLLMLIGVASGAASGFLPNASGTVTFVPAATSVALAAMIVAYNGPLKSTPLAPAAMGGCRALSFLLGASPVLSVAIGEPFVPRYIVGISFAMGVYVMGVTLIARDEATGNRKINLRTGFVVLLVGALLLAFAPGLARPQDRATWAIQPGGQFVFLIWLIILPVAVRAFRLQFEPEPQAIGHAVRAGVLTIIPLSAAFAFLGAGQNAGLAVFALLVPTIFLALRLRVT